MKFIIIFIVITVMSNSCNLDARRDRGLDSPQGLTKDSANSGKSVLFVQWQYPSEMDILDAMDVRHKLEDEIDNALKYAGIGQWIAGDMGPGGANMEYGVNGDQSKAVMVILKILTDQKLEKNSVIATNINFVDSNWVYKILYPKNYNKELNPG